MFEQWLKFWRQWMFWLLPGGDEPEKDKPAAEQNQQTTSTASETEAADVDAAATWEGSGSAEPVANDDAAKPTPPDDLTAIKGIGPAIARKLDALGVRTFTDLAEADPDDLAAKLASRPVTASRVQEWVTEAKKRVS